MARIVVVAAPEKFRETLCGVLTAYRHEIVTADAVEQAIRLLDGQAPDLVLFDLTLPGRPGLETLVTLRARAPHAPVIVFGDCISAETESRVREIGVSEVLRKGLKLDVLMQVINQALQQVGRTTRRSVTAPLHCGPRENGQPKDATILIVDDEPEIADLVGEFLASRGYWIQKASNGEDALAMIRRNPPDLVMLDVYMPKMNGVDVLRQLKAPMASADSPGVILLTASQDESLLLAALDLGAFDVLHKPVDLEQVELAVMVKLLLSAEP